MTTSTNMALQETAAASLSVGPAPFAACPSISLSERHGSVSWDFVDALSDGIYGIDPAGACTFVNRPRCACSVTHRPTSFWAVTCTR